MLNQKSIIISLDEKSEAVLRNLVKKHGLEESQEEVFTKISKHELLNENITIQLVRNLVSEKISTHDFLNALKKDLKLTNEKTKDLAKDIIHNLIPLLKIFTKEELKNYRSPKEPSTEKPSEKLGGETVREIILEKIKKRVPSEKATAEKEKSVSVKPKIKNVEENAEKLQQLGKKGQDAYRESFE